MEKCPECGYTPIKEPYIECICPYCVRVHGTKIEIPEDLAHWILHHHNQQFMLHHEGNTMIFINKDKTDC